MRGNTSLPARQRKGHDHSKQSDDADDEVLADALAESRSQGWSKPQWLVLIMVLVLANVLLGSVHMQRKARTKLSAAQEDSKVVKALSDESLPFHIAGHPNGTLVNFHTLDCSHCKKLAPEFEAAAKALRRIGDASLVSVDAALAPQALKRFGVTRYPTLLWFRRGELLRDVPPSVRTTPKILEFVDQSLQPSVIDFASRADFDEAVPELRSVLVGEALPVVVGFDRSPVVYQALQQAGEKFRGSTAFLFVKEAAEGDPNIRAYFRDPKSDLEYKGTLEFSELQKWLQPLMDQSKKKLKLN